MSTLPTGHGGPSLSGDPRLSSISNTRIGHSLTNNIHGDSNTNIGNVSNSYNTINMGVDDESSMIRKWLSPLEPHRRHRDVSNRRLDGVGDWVLQRDEFQSWYGSQDGSGDPTLLCYGDQGVGKTFISSLVIDSLREQTYGRNIAVLSLYCDYQAQKDQSAVNMVGSILSQIAFGTTQIPSEIRLAFERKRRGNYDLRLPDMVKLLVQTASSAERVYICFDALDELLPGNRSDLLRALGEITQEAPNIRLFLTGRPHIRRELDKHLAERAYIIHIVADQGDIARYVIRKMEDDDGDGDQALIPDDLKRDILKTMQERASQMFLLVALNIDAILGETSLARRKRMLQKVATTGVDLGSVYAETLQRIREQKGDRSRLGIEVLMWISHAERPLTIGELRHALAVEMGSADLNPENIPPQDMLLQSCLGLFAVDEEASTVRLIHYTLQEYLRLPDVLPAAHQTLALTCLAYLNSDQITRLPAENTPSLQDNPFLEYSSLYWGIHAKEGLSDGVKSLALELLSRYDIHIHISATLLLNQIMRFEYRFIAVSLFTGLHCASYFGIVEVVEALIQTNGRDINQRDCIGFTPLIWAAHEGNEAVVRLLLARDDVNPNEAEKQGGTPLRWASELGHEGVVGLLLARDDINPDQPNMWGRTPLWLASMGRQEGVARLLLARSDVNPDAPDGQGETPLSVACVCRSEGVARLLLVRDDVNPDKADRWGGTPLSNASVRGYEELVKLLLANDDVNPNNSDNQGRTALSHASHEGHEGVVRLLLARHDVDPDKPNDEGETPLWRACLRAHVAAVGLLLARGDVNPGRPDSQGRTPLQVATFGILRSRGDVNPGGLGDRGPSLPADSLAEYREIVALLEARTTAISSRD